MFFLTSLPLGMLGDPLKYPLRDVLSRICGLGFLGVLKKALGWTQSFCTLACTLGWAAPYPLASVTRGPWLHHELAVVLLCHTPNWSTAQDCSQHPSCSLFRTRVRDRPAVSSAWPIECSEPQSSLLILGREMSQAEVPRW